MRVAAVVLKSLRERIRDALRDASGGDLFFNEPMKRHTTLRIGGPADIYVAPKDPGALANILASLESEDPAFMPLGGGSNLLVSDEGMEGIILSTAFLNAIEMVDEGDTWVRLFTGAGTPLQKLVTFARDKGYSGLEGLAGIPGLLGGAVKGNAGSFGNEIGDVIESLRCADAGGKTFTLGRERLSFCYRSSNLPERTVIIGAVMKLAKGDSDQVADKMKACIEIKRETQPISAWSAGCVFKNPEGTPAGRLIDGSGCKGMRRGDIEVSSLHANFFINKGNGTAADFLALMEDVRERVMKSFDIALETEIEVVGKHGKSDR